MSKRKSSHKLLQEASLRMLGESFQDGGIEASTLFTDILPNVEDCHIMGMNDEADAIILQVNGQFPEGTSYTLELQLNDWYSTVEEDEEEQVGMDDMAELLSVESDVPEVKALQQTTRGQINKLRQQIQSSSY